MASHTGTGKGGARKRGGRPPGAHNVRTRAIAEAQAQLGITPLEYMMMVMRDPHADNARRDDMAKAAAPFMHARIAQKLEVMGPNGGPIQVTFTQLDAGAL